MTLDLDFVRSQFPGLEQGTIYLDNAGGTLVLKSVAEYAAEYMLNTSVQLGASYSVSQLASEKLEQSLKLIQCLIGAQSSKEVIMGSSSTMLLRQLAESLVKSWQPGDEVIVTDFDHEANIGAWKSLQQQGIQLKIWKLNPHSFTYSLNDLDELMTDKTRLVCITQASNILGTINPIKELSSFVHERGAKICVDGVAYAPHRTIDVQEWNVDYYVFSFYKVYGPHVSMLYGKYDDLLELENIYHYFFSKSDVPHKLQPGSCNYELTYACKGIIEYIDELGRESSCRDNTRENIHHAFEHIANHEQSICQLLLNYLTQHKQITIIGESNASKEQRLPIISFVVEQRNSQEIVTQMDKFNIGIRFGHFYAYDLIKNLGLEQQNGVIRVSMAHYNTEKEINRLIECFEQIL